jgi:uncharacterized protein
MKPTLSRIHIFPIKSCAPLMPGQAEVEARGLLGDRRWMIVDTSGRCVTARKHPRLVLLRARFSVEGLTLEAPGMPTLQLKPAADSDRIPVSVWDDTFDALCAEPAADAWISEHLGIPARFVHMDASISRPVDPDYSRSDDEVSFADGFPLLLISQASLDALNSRLEVPIPMLRFRPNLVIAGTEAHAEDGWRSIRIGELHFDVVKPCSRCVLTTVDTSSATFDSAGEPLRTLIGYRRTSEGVMFGQNLIARSFGTIRLGDDVEIDA